jgi:shikimate kinase
MTTGRSNLVLAGFMGTGKSTIGPLVAAHLGLAFVDTDAEIETRAGRTVAEIFAQEGEPAFRRIEAEVCLDAANRRRQLIAPGGGALLNERVRQAFTASGLIVCLTCDLDEIIRRVGRDPSRPLFAGERERLARLLEQRAPVYSSLPYQVDTTHLTPLQAAEEVIRWWQSNT